MKWILAAIATEALAELLVNAEILDKPRAIISRIAFFKDLFECKYCMSIYMGFFVFGILLLKAEVILIPIAISRVANYIDYFIRRKNAIRN